MVLLGSGLIRLSLNFLFFQEDDKAKLVEETGLQLKQKLVHQSKETQLAQQLSISYLSEVQAQEVERFSFGLEQI